MTAVSTNTWRKALLPVRSTIKDAIRNLNESALQIALVVSAEGALVGTITDGDIRRGLLRGLDVSSDIDSVIFREAMVVPPQLGRDSVLALMQANQISALPVVDDARGVIGLHVLKELLSPAERPNVMVIMAGGRGARLGPETEHCPKPLLPVAGRPMLEHIVERARAEGFRRFVFAVHYLGDMIERHFRDGSRWNVEIAYIRENSPLGTAGALGLLHPRPGSAFIVTNGDVLTDIRYGELLDFHCRHGAAATMAVRLYEWQHPYGVVHTRGVDIVGFEEKPVARSHVNAGIYTLQPGVLDQLSAGESCDMTTLFFRLQDRGQRTIVYPMHEPWLDVGLPDDLERARNGHTAVATAAPAASYHSSEVHRTEDK
jgi:dTDP-glucose pyrophosphorylase